MFSVHTKGSIKLLCQSFNKIPLFMRLCTLFLICSMSIAYAIDLKAQTTEISMNAHNQTVESVLDQISKSTGFDFFFNNKHVDLNRRVTVDMKNGNIFTLLDMIFADTNVHYSVLDKKIILTVEGSKEGMMQQQVGRVTGKILDANGEPIIGASILEKGTTNGTVSDLDGNFSLSLNNTSTTLEISYIGYQTQTITVRAGQSVNVTMKEDMAQLEEVVVVGYGSQKKANLTGAVTAVNMKEALGDRPITSVSAALQGAVPGLYVSSGGNSAGTAASFRIRGAYTLGSSGGAVIEPLVLIDNVEGDINLINPEDIESVSVLKDAASTAIYGARAAGGVILITTKHPKEKTAFQLNYNNNFSFENAINLPEQAPLEDYLHAYQDAAGDQFWTMASPRVSRWLELLDSYKKNPSSMTTYGDGIYKDTDGAIYYLNEKDLVKDMLNTGFQQKHNISASGGTDKLRYRISGGLVSSDGVLITNKDKYRRMNINAFISADINKWFTQEANLSYAKSKKTLPSSALGAIYSTRLSSFYPEGNMPEEMDPNAAGLPFFTPASQVKWSNPSKTLNDNPRIFLKSIIKPFKNFEIDFEYTFDKMIYDYHWYTGSNQYTTVQGGVDTTPTVDYLNKVKRYRDYNAINLYGTYNLDLKDHHIKLMAGYNQESSYQETMTAYSYSQAVKEVPALASGTSTITASDAYSEYAIRGGFFRVNYNYMERYLLEINGRYDGSSKFPKDNRFGFFPSVSAGWNIARESFMQDVDWLGTLKLRVSYGVVGNQNINNYAYYPTMSVNNKYNQWIMNGDYVTAVTTLPSLVSSSFTWEKVRTFDIGLDWSMFNNRLVGSFDYYQKKTYGMLAPGMQLPAVVGAEAPWQNTADMKTKGWDFNISYRDRIGKVGYNLGFNISDYESEIVKYDSNESKLLSNYYKGQKLGEIWGYVFDDFYSVNDFENTSSWVLKEGVAKIDGYNPRPGDVKFKNLRDDDRGTNLISSGDDTVDNPGDRKIIGNNTPRYVYGINLGLDYKGFALSVFAQGTGKRDTWIANNILFPLYPDYKFIALYNNTSDYWKPVNAANGDYTCANPDAKYPRIYGDYGNRDSNYRRSDKYLSDASYLRIKNVTLSYSFPSNWINRYTLTNLRLFVNVENLATFTSLKQGIDPETLSWNYPAFRTISFGLNVTL